MCWEYGYVWGYGSYLRKYSGGWLWGVLRIGCKRCVIVNGNCVSKRKTGQNGSKLGVLGQVWLLGTVGDACLFLAQ